MTWGVEKEKRNQWRRYEGRHQYQLAPRQWADVFRFRAPRPFVGFLQRVSVTLHWRISSVVGEVMPQQEIMTADGERLIRRRKVLALDRSPCHWVMSVVARWRDEWHTITLLRAQLGLRMLLYLCHWVIRTHVGQTWWQPSVNPPWVDRGLSVINKTPHREWVVVLLLASFWQMAPTKVCLGW